MPGRSNYAATVLLPLFLLMRLILLLLPLRLPTTTTNNNNYHNCNILSHAFQWSPYIDSFAGVVHMVRIGSKCLKKKLDDKKTEELF